MQQPAKIDLYADRDIAFVETIGIWEQDFTSASFRMQVRLRPDTPGSPIISLTTVTGSTAQGVRLAYGGTDTIANHILTGRTTPEEAAEAGYVDTTDTVALSLLSIRISAGALALGSYPADEAGDDLYLSYDLLITPAGGDEDKWSYGTFAVRGTVTQ